MAKHLRQPIPSERLSSRGKIIKDTFYLIDEGFLRLEDGIRVPCQFEVAHMKDGHSWVIVYIDPSEVNDLIEYQIDQNIFNLIGRDVFWDAILSVSIYQWVSKNLTHEPSTLRLECLVWRYEAVHEVYETYKVDFFLANLSVSRKYSYESESKSKRFKFRENMHEARLNAAIKSAIEVEYEGKTSEEVHQIAKDTADVAKKEFITKNNKPLLKTYIPLTIDKIEIARIYWHGEYDKREYDSQPLAMLQLNMQNLPDSWNKWRHEEMAEWICGLLSLALGREISWRYYHIPHMESIKVYRVPQRVWYSRSINEGRFPAFTENNGYFRTDFGIDEDSQSLVLVQDVINYLLEIGSENANKYLGALQTYVRYASTPASSDEFKCTLLCSLGEHIYDLWEKVTENKYQNLTSSQKRKIRKDIKPVLAKYKDLIIKEQQQNESDEEYDRRVNDELHKLWLSLEHGLDGSLVAQFIWLFEQNGISISDKEVSYYGNGYRIRQFVKSRDNLFHNHNFCNDFSANEQRTKEVWNIQHFIPLLLAIVLKYKGRYWHPLVGNNRSEKWEWMPRK